MKSTTVSDLRKDLSNAMEDQACQWIARLRADDADEADHEQFALWLAANPAHGRAMDRMQNLWEDLGAVAHLPLEATVKVADPGRRRWFATGFAAAIRSL